MHERMLRVISDVTAVNAKGNYQQI